MEENIRWIPVKEYLLMKEWEEEWRDRQIYSLWNGSMEGYKEYRIEKTNNKILADDILKRNKPIS